MQTYAHIEELYTFRKVNFYSVHLEENELSETEKFIQKFQGSDYHEDFMDIIAWIKEIGEHRGAIPELFRHEADAQALPPGLRIIEKRGLLKEIGYNLRLYCVVISEKIVILLNGGIKQSEKVQGSPDLLAKFRLANKISKVLTERIKYNEIQIIGKKLKGDLELIF